AANLPPKAHLYMGMVVESSREDPNTQIRCMLNRWYKYVINPGCQRLRVGVVCRSSSVFMVFVAGFGLTWRRSITQQIAAYARNSSSVADPDWVHNELKSFLTTVKPSGAPTRKSDMVWSVISCSPWR
ncbi:hypothetical protein NDU88_005829, partial [Pleurodeles waltl]